MKNRLHFLTILFLSISFFAYAQNEQIDLANQYLHSNEKEKAKELFEKLAKDEDNLKLIHKNYFELLLETKDFKEAEKHLKKIQKKIPDNIEYQVDAYFLEYEKDGPEKASGILTRLIQIHSQNLNAIRRMASYLYLNNRFDAAEQVLLSRENDFKYDLAALYGNTGQKSKMIDKYLEILDTNPYQLEYVLNTFQNTLREEEELTLLESKAFVKIQQSPDKIIYNEILKWIYIQQKSFKKAFIQAKAIDRRRNDFGYEILELANLAKSNLDFEAAISMYEFIIEKYKGTINYSVARTELVKTKEIVVKNTYPINKEKILSLIEDYKGIINELGFKASGRAIRNMALLYGFYLDDKKTAQELLLEIIQNRLGDNSLLAEAKLDLGDIYLLLDEHWEASLLYSQVEKAEKGSVTAHLAKLKNAKLNYYKGDFELAEGHLDVLKKATSKEIANDAMELALLIKDNLNLDTTDVTMKLFANAELLVFQNKLDEALAEYEKMMNEYPNHTLTDEILMAMSKIYLREGKNQLAIENLKKIVENYSEDILADDANFMLGEIYELKLNDKEMAMEYYKNQLIKFPGSLYNVEARKRFRTLRGDKIN